MSWNIESFREKLESEHTFPGPYLFKFIVPVEKKDEVLKILPRGDVSLKESSKATYVSITLKAQVIQSQQVIDIYSRAYQIEGIVAL
jgi:putative lipoic acid-binding regulatory protein